LDNLISAVIYKTFSCAARSIHASVVCFNFIIFVMYAIALHLLVGISLQKSIVAVCRLFLADILRKSS